MRFSLALWLRQWTQPALFYRRRSAFYRRVSRWYYRFGKSCGDRFALMSNADFLRALAAESKPGREP
jgi:hypothetical protein